MLVRGDHMGTKLQRDVLARYVHRWTVENAQQSYGGKCPGCEQSRQTGPNGEPVVLTGVPGKYRVWTLAEWHAHHAPLVTDAEWLRAYAFHVTKQGELDGRRHHAEPASLVG